jgi:murein DD-endopeptidase MepM/ murein hydrolase activator NlpD
MEKDPSPLLTSSENRCIFVQAVEPAFSLWSFKRLNNMRRPLTLAITLLTSALAAAGPLTITPMRLDGGKAIAFAVENPKPYPITLTLDFPEIENLAPDESLPQTRTLMPGDRVETARLNVIDESVPGRWQYQYQWTSGASNVVPDMTHQYRLPYAPGSAHLVIQSFNGTFSHGGDDRFCVDWAMPEGTAVYAARSGRVMNVRSDNEGAGGREYYEKANYVRVLHSDGTVGVYLHLRKDGVSVAEGDVVEEGSLIGYSGNTGFSSQPHLHFGVYRVIDGARQESIPIQFRSTSENGLSLTRGRAYQN